MTAWSLFNEADVAVPGGQGFCSRSETVHGGNFRMVAASISGAVERCMSTEGKDLLWSFGTNIFFH
jgi:hypothetical protein